MAEATFRDGLKRFMGALAGQAAPRTPGVEAGQANPQRLGRILKVR
jgi:hypothetical protein